MSDIVEHLIPTRTCVIAFASGGGDFSGDLPHFEFGRHLQELGLAHVLLRDSTGFSHQYGIHGIGDRASVVRYLICKGRRYPRLILIGLSVGALAALMYGQLAADQLLNMHTDAEVIALSPYTSLGNNAKVVFGPSWHERCPWPSDTDSVSLLIDLLPLYAHGPKLRTRAFISNGQDTEHDRWHAERIGITDVIMIPGSSHAGLGKLMRDSGMLRKLLRDEAGLEIV